MQLGVSRADHSTRSCGTSPMGAQAWNSKHRTADEIKSSWSNLHQIRASLCRTFDLIAEVRVIAGFRLLTRGFYRGRPALVAVLMGDLFRSGEPLFRSGECLFRSGESRQRKRPGGPPVGHSPALGRCLPTRARAPIAKRLSGGQHASAPSSSANAGNARPRPGGERQRPSLRSGTGSPVDSMDGVDKRPERRRGGDRCRLTTPTTLTTGRADGLSPFPEERPDGEGGEDRLPSARSVLEDGPGAGCSPATQSGTVA